ncbi:hypothetical protein AX17_004496 [Amanita inopinata Kibby_2008]|nr:hypothetical protein AX17_004496 [Amanita inopinata Kibby_2008]
MSKSLSSPLAPQLLSRTSKQVDDASRDIVLNNTQSVPLHPSTASAGPSTWQPPSHWNLEGPVSAYQAKNSAKLKSRLPEEQEIIARTAARFASSLASDHAAVLSPDVDSPFVDYVDVVKRLLPYHVFQQPQEDLANLVCNKKGKGKATESNLGAEIAETRFALECCKRKEALKTRFKKVLVQSAKRSAPDDQAYVLAQAVLEADRLEMTWLNNELRSARSELDKLEKDKRAIANASRATSMQNAYMHAQYYRSYPYTYAQPYGASPAVPSSSISTFSVAPSIPTPMNTGVPYQAGAAIPVQLPVASLPALHALGIVPVPASSLPPEGQVQPPAVLRGSTANGTMLSLEINVSLLQSAQMSGLAMVLNSLMSRSGGGVGTGYTTGAATTGTVQPPVSNGTPTTTMTNKGRVG